VLKVLYQLHYTVTHQPTEEGCSREPQNLLQRTQKTQR